MVWEGFTEQTWPVLKYLLHGMKAMILFQSLSPEILLRTCARVAWHGEAAQIFQPQPLPVGDHSYASVGPATATEPVSSLECMGSLKSNGSPKGVSKSCRDAVWARLGGSAISA